MTYIVPRDRSDMLDFFRAHLGPWQSDPASIGLSAAQVAQLALLLEEAESSDYEARMARQRALTATQANTQRMKSLRRFGVSLMATIRATASVTEDDQVYTAAQIPPPSPPSATPPPESPTDVRAQPLSHGPIVLTWAGSIAHGQTFQIFRSIDGAPFTHAAAGRFKTWTDTRVPVGSRRIDYRISAERGGRTAVNAAQVSVSFGTVDGTQHSSNAAEQQMKARAAA